MERKQALKNLINLSAPPLEVKEHLNNYPWDYNGRPIIFTQMHINNACQKLFDGMISEQYLKDWANIIECREDIEFKKEQNDIILQCIYELANPSLIGQSIREIARSILDKK